MPHSPYRQSVRDLIHRPGEMRERSLDLTVPERIGEGLMAVERGAKMHLEVRLESVHEGILATVEVDTVASAECGRCLEPFTETLELEFQELFAYSVQDGDEYGVHDDHVDLEPPLRDAVVLSLPFQPVCRPDCAGLDPVTGKAREEGEGADAHHEGDPRWSVLSQLLEKRPEE